VAYIYGHLMEVPAEMRQHGLGTAILASQLSHFAEDVGAKRMEILANIKAGGYVWPSLGYDFEDWHHAAPVLQTMEQLADLAEKNRYSDLAELIRGKAEGYENDRPHSWEIAEDKTPLPVDLVALIHPPSPPNPFDRQPDLVRDALDRGLTELPLGKSVMWGQELHTAFDLRRGSPSRAQFKKKAQERLARWLDR
jgi:hypothetical protein